MGFILGGIVVTYLLLRLWQWILTKLPVPWTVRLAISIVLAFATVTILAGFGYANGGPPVFGLAAQSYLISMVIAGFIEAIRQYKLWPLNMGVQAVEKPPGRTGSKSWAEFNRYCRRTGLSFAALAAAMMAL